MITSINNSNKWWSGIYATARRINQTYSWRNPINVSWFKPIVHISTIDENLTNFYQSVRF